MRKYTPKDNVQGKSYYTDRFWVAPRVPRMEVEEGSHFANVLKALGKKAKETYIEIGTLVVHIDAKKNLEIIKILKEKCGYTQCSEQSAVDYLANDGEFELFYQLLNITEAKRIRVVCRLKKGAAIESITPLFKSANFAEREMFDMFGIYVNNHPFLKRILMPDDWHGHPLLKTYPLHGDEAASWYEVDKIFGKEYRDVIGPENRDPSRIDRYDTKRFSRVGYEVPFGADISEGEKENPIEYSETILVDYTKDSGKQLDERR
ncbi:NADH-ubiquinone oxidoreductase chain C [hydrothermal vent metagenome]|uniref:NADH-ubiquinone oxidoreductase chain C n=1 Tax=hydrothermal vent metagenome TaxID=652676 RepID=A0A1W1C2R8_9ZZZZ